jgi:hypothetical protein
MPVGEPAMGEPQDMSQDFNDNMGEIPVDKEDEKSDSEIDDIFSKLDTEKQAAVIKYAKSMVDDEGTESEPQTKESQMPGEDEMVTEIANNVLDDRKEKPEEGEDKRIRNKKVTKANPFITKDFNKVENN